MKLHSLRVTAFGPFADTVEVDFDEVSAAGLFLIQGPTGAGKTSLLDAICYCLYAGLPGTRRGSRRLRSDHAVDTAVPRVQLDFTTGRRRFRVTRCPEFERPKKRGTGTTKAPATVLLEEHTGGAWVVRSTRNDEVGEIVTEVLGMGLEQFSKVVLLPQGEFSAFLRADAEERRALLERLFDISTWTGVEEWLVEQRRALAERVEQSRAGVVTDLARLRDVVVTLPAEVAGDHGWTVEDLPQLPAALGAVLERCEEHVGSTLASLDAADGQVTGAELTRLEVESLAERQRRARAAAAQLAALADEEAGVVEAVSLVRRSRLADLVTADVDARDRARARVDASGADVARLRRRLGLAPEVDPVGVDLALAELTGHDTALVDARRAEREQHEVGRRLQQLRARGASATLELDQLSETAPSLARREDSARDAVEAHRARSLQLSALRSRQETLGELVRVATTLRTARAEAVRLGDELREARDAELGGREAYLSARQSRLDGMAAELAAQLEGDRPCPVCGALEHPLPATAAGDAVSPAEVSRAEEAWHDLRDRRDQVAHRLAAARATVDSRTVDLIRQLRAEQQREAPAAAPDPTALQGALPTSDADVLPMSDADLLSAADPEAWVAELARVRSTVAGLTDPPGTAEVLDTRLVTASEAVRAHHRRMGELAQAVAADTALLVEVEGSLTALRRRRDDVLAAHATCPCRGADLADLADDPAGHDDGAVDRTLALHTRHGEGLRELQARWRSVDEDTAELSRCETHLTRALHERGFATVDEVRASALPPAEVSRLEARAQDARARRAAAEQVLADEQVNRAAQLPPADEVGAAQAAHEARSRQRAAQQDDVIARQAHQQLGLLVSSLRAACADLLPLTARSDQVGDLAGLVTGVGADNTLRMRLSSYVLAARLEKVAALANERLAVMGDGRYQLQHSDGLDSGRRRSGLGLVVRDLWTGAVRDTATLSGGESFMASLALALGLADAVREEAGGFDLQTLFVDEGFGTLDDDSLEEVLAVLDGLREGGRAVGVVSHVGDLRARIPTQICVTKTHGGSSVAVRHAFTPAA